MTDLFIYDQCMHSHVTHRLEHTGQPDIFHVGYPIGAATVIEMDSFVINSGQCLSYTYHHKRGLGPVKASSNSLSFTDHTTGYYVYPILLISTVVYKPTFRLPFHTRNAQAIWLRLLSSNLSIWYALPHDISLYITK